ncbi:MAG: acetate--CoA ligase family protein [Planctomycetes bacterium]|nr:acetate--CoA ligase family protein [Planctomycetota bacterium]
MGKRVRSKSLDGLFRPRSVAVIGASRREHSIGNEVVKNLVGSGFTGTVYPVNRRAKVVRSMQCYAKLADIEGPVDLAVLVVPAEHVLASARDCAAKGVRGLVVVSAGFREIGGEGEERERELVQIAHEAGMRIIGPNCMGIVNTEPAFSLNASFASCDPLPGRVGFVSQSGALGEAILADARSAGLGIRMFASVGNRADVGAHDLLEYWEHDEGVEIILLYLESFGDPERFQAVAERLRGKKPILAVKSGRSAAGARAAGSHTGSVVSRDEVIDTFLAQCGVQRVRSMRELFEVASVLLRQPLPHGEGVAVITNAGGPGILATDALATLGLEPVAFENKTLARLEKVLPPEASAQNPVDLIASADAARYGAALDAIVVDRNVNALLVLFVSPIMIDAEAVARAILASSRKRDKPLVVCFMGRKGDVEARQLFEAEGVPMFRFPEDAARTIAGMIQARRLAHSPRGASAKLRVDRRKAERLLSGLGPEVLTEHGGWVPASTVRDVLAAYGLPILETKVAEDFEDARTIAKKLGLPVVVKAAAPTLLHKSEESAVRTGIENEDELVHVVVDMSKRLGRRHPGLQFEIQPMAQGFREFLVGFDRDERFGPIITVGFGGVFVEVLRDVAIRIGPLRDTDPKSMLDSLRGHALLEAFRGQPAIDRAGLEDVVLRVDRLAQDFPNILELDCNPLIVGDASTPMAIVDVRMRLR